MSNRFKSSGESSDAVASISAVAILTAGMWWLYSHSTGLIEPGDGLLHYQIAKWSWVHPELFLHHWGKPLFTLLSSPFAQFGHGGMVVFNLLCYGVSALLMCDIGRRLGFTTPWLGAMILVAAPVYSRMVMAGMTEVLFATTLLAVVRAALTSRLGLAAVFMGAGLFMRPEAILIAPFVALYILIHRPSRIWLMLMPLLLYSLVGWFMIDDFLWFFHDNPYKDNDGVYGSGDFWTFLSSAKGISGIPLLIGFVAAVALTLGRRTFRWRITERGWWWLLLIIGPITAVWFVHSLVWALGIRGSMGLTRVFATVTPLFGLVAWAGIDGLLRLPKLTPRLKTVAAVVVSLILVAVSLDRLKLPKHIELPNRLMTQALDEVAPMIDGHVMIHYLDPYVGHHLDLDPFDGSRVRLMWNGTAERLGDLLSAGDIVVWESHFARVDGSVSFSAVQEVEGLKLLTERMAEENEDHRWPDYRLVIFRYKGGIKGQ